MLKIGSGYEKAADLEGALGLAAVTHPRMVKQGRMAKNFCHRPETRGLASFSDTAIVQPAIRHLLVDEIEVGKGSPVWTPFMKEASKRVTKAFRCGTPIVGHSAGSSVAAFLLRGIGESTTLP